MAKDNGNKNRTVQNEDATIYNKQQAFKKNILPHLQHALKEALKLDIPFFCGAAVYNDIYETKYHYMGNMTGSSGITLSEDHFERHLLVANGFDAVPPSNSITFEKIGQMQLRDWDKVQSYTEQLSDVEGRTGDDIVKEGTGE